MSSVSFTSVPSAFSLGLPRHRGISSRCGSDRHPSVRPQWPCPRNLMALTASAKFPPKCSLTPAQSPSSTRSLARSARREAAVTCVGQRWSRSSLEGEVPCSRTRLPRLATTTARHPRRSLSVYPIRPLSLVLDNGIMGIQMGR